MFVVYKVYLKQEEQNRKGVQFERLREFREMEEAVEYMKNQPSIPDVSCTVMIE